MKRLVLLIPVMCAVAMSAMAERVKIIMIPDHADAIYKVGEQVKMNVILTDCGLALNGATIDYEISEDLMPAHEKKTITLKGYETTIKVGTKKKPGFVRVRAKVKHAGKNYSAMSTVGFDPQKLTPYTEKPEDFDEFWAKNLEKLKKVDLRPKMELLADRCTEKVDVYHVSYGNIGGSRMYGVLTMPKKEGKYPAVLRLPGASVSPKGGDIKHAEQGVIVLELGIHGIPVNLEGSIYDDLSSGVLSNYQMKDIDDVNAYYYRRVYLGCVKGIDFLLSLPQCSGKVGTLGGSQGGALSLVTSRLDSRVKATAVYFPALCDQEAYMNNRAGGWPHVLKYEGNRTKEIINTVRYYDASNFARGLKAPVFYAFGYNDITCAPSSTYSTYNVIPAPKQLSIGADTGHWLHSEQVEAMWNWIIEELR